MSKEWSVDDFSADLPSMLYIPDDTIGNISVSSADLSFGKSFPVEFELQDNSGLNCVPPVLNRRLSFQSDSNSLGFLNTPPVSPRTVNLNTEFPPMDEFLSGGSLINTPPRAPTSPQHLRDFDMSFEYEHR